MEGRSSCRGAIANHRQRIPSALRTRPGSRHAIRRGRGRGIEKDVGVVHCKVGCGRWAVNVDARPSVGRVAVANAKVARAGTLIYALALESVTPYDGRVAAIGLDVHEPSMEEGVYAVPDVEYGRVDREPCYGHDHRAAPLVSIRDAGVAQVPLRRGVPCGPGEQELNRDSDPGEWVGGAGLGSNEPASINHPTARITIQALPS